MTDILIISNGIVVNCIAADSAARAAEFYPLHQCIVRTEALAHVSPGDHYDGEAFTRPAVAEDRRVTKLAFLSRFTDSEAVAIDLASHGATVQAAAMRRYLSKVNSAIWIDMQRPDTRGGVIALEAAGLLAAGRALEILDGPIAPHERALEAK